MTMTLKVIKTMLMFSSDNNTWESNIIGAIEGQIALIGSANFMEIIEKSSIMDAEIFSGMYKSILMGYLDSENLAYN